MATGSTSLVLRHAEDEQSDQKCGSRAQLMANRIFAACMPKRCPHHHTVVPAPVKYWCFGDPSMRPKIHFNRKHAPYKEELAPVKVAK
ncbi:hypothetical protein RRF57_008815 [Xylaria bambusicola]|uniref:Uncharacterized protein n=1 Tax=Xylaria bambusicola TaxID=326684 RepID=A0AAN7UVX6_9PEZI